MQPLKRKLDFDSPYPQKRIRRGSHFGLFQKKIETFISALIDAQNLRKSANNLRIWRKFLSDRLKACNNTLERTGALALKKIPQHVQMQLQKEPDAFRSFFHLNPYTEITPSLRPKLRNHFEDIQELSNLLEARRSSCYSAKRLWKTIREIYEEDPENLWKNLEILWTLYDGDTSIAGDDIGDDKLTLSFLKEIRKKVLENGDTFKLNGGHSNSAEELIALAEAKSHPSEYAIRLNMPEHFDFSVFRDRPVNSILDLVCRAGHQEILDLILDRRFFHDKILHIAAAYGRESFIEPILNSQPININWQDDSDHTALHYACKNSHVGTAKKLIALGANVWAENREGLNPFELALDEEQFTFFIEYFDNHPFIQEILESEEPHDLLHLCYEQPEKLIKNSKNPLEICFLLKDATLLIEMRQLLSPLQFYTYVTTLNQPKLYDWVEKECFVLNPEHLQKNRQIEIPPPPNVDIKELKNMFHSINFSDPEQPGYMQRSEEHISYLETGISRLIRCVKDKDANIIGLPRQDEIDRFYSHIEIFLQHITNILQNESDPFHRANMLFDLANAGKWCAGRMIGSTTLIYQLLTSGDPTQTLSLEAIIAAHLTHTRIQIVQNLAGSAAHGFNHRMRLLSEIANLPGTQFLKEFHDPHGGSYDQERVAMNFFKRYSVSYIIETTKEELERLYSDFTTRDLVVDWFDDHPIDIESDLSNVEKLAYQIFDAKPDGTPLPKFRRQAIWHFLTTMQILA